MNKSDIQEIITILKQYGNQKLNTFFAAIITSSSPIRFYYNANDGDWIPTIYPEDTKFFIEQISNLVLLHYDWQYFIVATSEGIPSAIKQFNSWLDEDQIKSVAYQMITLSNFLNNSYDSKDELNICNFIKSLIIELSDMISNEKFISSGKSNIECVTNYDVDWNFMVVIADRMNALFKLLELVEQKADLIPFMEERYEVYLQLLNK